MATTSYTNRQAHTIHLSRLQLRAASVFPRGGSKRGPRDWGWLPGGRVRPRPQLGFA